ncbi:MAG: carbohydrate porin [Emcibacter sp.]|nr:carbohydrate porin [Emcibacter sp.]
MEKKYFVLSILIAFFAPTAAFADTPPSLTGDITYTGELWQNADGGIKNDAVYLHNIDLSLEGNLEHYGVKGGSFFLYGLITNKNELSSDLVGDLQVISNIDNGESFRLYEAWYQHEFTNIRAKMGLIDLNSEFDAIETAGLFLNSSHGIGPDFSQTGENGPSIFPSTSPALVIEYNGFQNWRLLAGLFDAVPNDPDRPGHHKLSLNEGALLVGEINYKTTNGLRWAFGFYGYTAKFTTLADPALSKRGNTGFYTILEAPLTDKIAGWLRFGSANSDLNPLKNYMGGGLVLTAPFVSRPDDQIGIALGGARAGKSFKQLIEENNQRPATGEFNIELTYHYRVSDTISIQPDLQYVINPGSNHALKNALVIGVRFQVGQRF